MPQNARQKFCQHFHLFLPGKRDQFLENARTSPLEAATGDIETSKRQHLDLEATQTPKNTENKIGQSFVIPER